MAGPGPSPERDPRRLAIRSAVRLYQDRALPRHDGATVGRRIDCDPAPAGQEECEGPEIRAGGSAAAPAVRRRATPRRRRPSAGRMDVAEQRAEGMGDHGATGVLLLLAVADRELLQAAQEPRP